MKGSHFSEDMMKRMDDGELDKVLDENSSSSSMVADPEKTVLFAS